MFLGKCHYCPFVQPIPLILPRKSGSATTGRESKGRNNGIVLESRSKTHEVPYVIALANPAATESNVDTLSDPFFKYHWSLFSLHRCQKVEHTHTHTSLHKHTLQIQHPIKISAGQTSGKTSGKTLLSNAEQAKIQLYILSKKSV